MHHITRPPLADHGSTVIYPLPDVDRGDGNAAAEIVTPTGQVYSLIGTNSNLCEATYQKDIPMTTPNEPDTISLPQLRDMLRQLHTKIDGLTGELSAIRDGLAHAATPPASQPTGETVTFPATRLERERVKGKTYYRMMGGKYTKHGLRVWPEVLQAIGLDPEQITWADDDSYTITPPLPVAALVEPHKDKDGNDITGPVKVIGLA